MFTKDKKTIIGYLFFIVIAIAAFIFFVPYRRDSWGDDIHFVWMEGERILAGKNPYERILSGNMRDDNYYPIYFPLFYLLSSLTQMLGLKDFSTWLIFWHPVSLLFNIGTAFLIFFAFFQRKKTSMAIFSSLFWLFNRWTLHGVLASYLDFMPIFFLIFSLLVFKKHRWISLFLLSLSLALKQMAIFLIPLYLIWIWHLSDKKPVRAVLIGSFIIASVPGIVSLPFIFLNAQGFLRSIFFSATRSAIETFNAPSFDIALGLAGFPARVPMLTLMALIYFSSLQKKINMFISAFFTMFTFICFNPVLFGQHMCWVIPLIPLSVCSVISNNLNE